MNKLSLIIISLIQVSSVVSFSQRLLPPIPVEFMLGHENMYYQLVVKRPFSDESKFDFFGLGTYTANYEDDVEENRVISITQISYKLGKGFGLMGGSEINSSKGFSTIFGPQHTFVNKKVLAATVVSFFLNEQNDFKIFGLYEFKPSINDKLSLYTRMQFIYGEGIRDGKHNKSFIYLRAGIKKKSMILGIASNFDWSGAGSDKSFTDNYGPFIRWEFR